MCQSNTVESIPPGGSLDRQRLITTGFKSPEGMFTFLSNRASTSFAEALIPLGGRVYEPGNTHIDFCYWNSYSGETLPQDVTLGFSLLNRQKTIPLDNKKLLAQRLMLLGLCNPPVYTDPEDIPGNAEGLWYIKNPMSTAGRGISVVRTKDIAAHIAPGDIVQQAVTDILLHEGRKYTVRIYLLLWNSHLYLYPEGIAARLRARQ